MKAVDTEALMVGMQCGLPTLLWGDPGIGKSSLVESLAVALNLPIQTVIASIREPSDFSGLPVVDNDSKSVWFAAPQWAKAMTETSVDEELAVMGLTGMLFFDELSTAPPAVQAALLRVILGRMVGDTKIPDSVAMMAAANPPETSAGGWEMTAPLANRFIHLQAKASASAFCDGMVAGWATPPVKPLNANWKKQKITTRASVASFIKARPDLLFKFPENSENAGGAWPSPRTWEYLSTVEAACRNNATEEAEAMLMAGCTGEGASLEYTAWRRNLDLPDPEMLLRDPGKLALPDRGDKAYAILTSVVAAVLSDLTPDRWLAGWEVMGNASNNGKSDVAAPCARILAMNKPTEKTTAPEAAAAFGELIVKSGMA
tara:strand:+ start:6038 stop:7159 length:1122 start_codon:yes stop_codon:yes gene_type:complete